MSKSRRSKQLVTMIDYINQAMAENAVSEDDYAIVISSNHSATIAIDRRCGVKVLQSVADWLNSEMDGASARVDDDLTITLVIN